MPVKARRVAIAQPKQKPQTPPPERWNGNILDLKCIGRGISAMVFTIDDGKVVKVDFGSDQSKADLATERRAYKILEEASNRSPHIIRCFELDNPRGLILERCPETVRRRLRSLPSGVFPSDLEVRQWAKQAAEGLAFIHQHDIIHADVGCHNMLLTSSDVLKLCDFGGSSVKGSVAATKYEVWSRPPFKDESPPTNMSDLFALGSAIYEMSTKEVPYCGKAVTEIPKLYQKGQFPPVRKIASLGHVIIKCWAQKYARASDIVREIDPQKLLCCPDQEDSARGGPDFLGEASNLSTIENAAKCSTSTSEVAQIRKRNSLLSSNTSHSSPPSSALSTKTLDKTTRKWTLGTLSAVNSARSIHGRQQSVDYEVVNKTFWGTASSRDKRKPARKKTRNHSLFSQWIKSH